MKNIQRASLNGENIKVLINDSLNFVNGLTIDYNNDRIYWVDAAFDKIESSTLDGDDRRKVEVQGMYKRSKRNFIYIHYIYEILSKRSNLPIYRFLY